MPAQTIVTVSQAERELLHAQDALDVAVKRRELVGEPVSEDVIGRVEQAKKRLAEAKEGDIGRAEKVAASTLVDQEKKERETHARRLKAIADLVNAGQEFDQALVQAGEALDDLLNALRAAVPLLTPWQSSIVSGSSTLIGESIKRLFSHKLMPGQSTPLIFISDKLNDLNEKKGA